MIPSFSSTHTLHPHAHIIHTNTPTDAMPLSRTPLAPDPGYEHTCNFYPKGAPSDPTPQGRVRPEAVDIARLHTRGSVSMLLQLQEEPQLYSRYKRMYHNLMYAQKCSQCSILYAIFELGLDLTSVRDMVYVHVGTVAHTDSSRLCTAVYQ